MINRQKLIEELEKKYRDIAKEDDERWVWWNRAIYTAVHIIKDQPTADQDCSQCRERGKCAIHDNFNIDYCSDWRLP